MATEKIASKLVNKVRFDLDKASLDKSIKAINKFKKHFQSIKDVTTNTKAMFSVKQAKATVRNAKNTENKIKDMKMKASKTLLAEMEKEKAAFEKRATKRRIREDLRQVRIDTQRKLREAVKAQNLAASKQERVTVRGLQFEEALRKSSKLSPAQIDKARSSMSELDAVFLSTSMSGAMYSQQTGEIIRNLARQNKQSKSLVATMHKLRSVFVAATASYTAFSGALAVAETGSRFQNLEIGLTAAFGDKAQDNMKFLAKEADRVGINMLALSKDYVRFAAATSSANVPLEDQRASFSGLLEASRVFGLSSEQTSLALKAMVQSFNKGTVMSEEFKQQFGEQMPAALDVAAKAMGVQRKEFIKMMEQGEILATEFWPKFFKQYKNITDPALLKATRSFSAGQERLINVYERLKNTIFKSGLETTLTRIYSAAESFLLTLDRFFSGGFGAMFSGFLNGLTFIVRLVAAALDDMSYYIVKWSGGSTKEIDKVKEAILELTGTVIGLLAAIKLLGKFKGFKDILPTGGPGTSKGTPPTSPKGKGSFVKKILGYTGAATDFLAKNKTGVGVAAAGLGTSLLVKSATEGFIDETHKKLTTRSGNDSEEMRRAVEIFKQEPVKVDVGIHIEDSKLSDVFRAETKYIGDIVNENWMKELSDAIPAK